jgi:formylglycine-generating enzyme required for sulfatase activity
MRRQRGRSSPITIADWTETIEQRNVVFGEPAGYWCYVPPKRYRFGGWHAGQASRAVDLAAFWIARVPITVAQYTHMQESRCEECFSPHNHAFHPSAAPERQIHPQVGVSWFNAMAFAGWLQHHLAPIVPRDYQLRLPTEIEWEVAAACGRDGRRSQYPWGDGPLTPERALFAAADTAIVGSYPAGAAECGALDLLGNVWEWTLSAYADYPALPSDLRNGVVVVRFDRVLRGGAYYSSAASLSCAARFRYLPDDFVRGYGFRLVLAIRLPRSGRSKSEPEPQVAISKRGA